jgi:hypothetical protein
MTYSAAVVVNGSGEWPEGDMSETITFVSQMSAFLPKNWAG